MDHKKRSKHLKILYGSDKYENSAQANIQGVEIHIKIKINGYNPTMPVLAGIKQE